MKPTPMWRRFDRLFGADRASDVRDELRFHLEAKIDDLIARGLTPEAARREAERQFGDLRALERIGKRMGAKMERRKHIKDYWGDAARDLRYAIRSLCKSPGFALVAILTLALGIGANTAIFSALDAVLFRPLPVADQQHLVVFSWSAHHYPKQWGQSDYGDCADQYNCSLSVPVFQTLHAQNANFANIAAFVGPFEVNVSGNGPATIARGEFVSGDWFSTLGLNTFLGRPLGPADDTPSAPPAIVLNYNYWQRAFGADRSAVGRTVRLNGVEVLIAGVAQPNFQHITPGKLQDFFMPLSLASRVRSEWWGTKNRLTDPTTFWVLIVARLKPGVSVAQAQSVATAIFRSQVVCNSLFVADDAPTIALVPIKQALSGESFSIAPILDIIMAAVGLVLLIACANVAGLILARSAKRQKEMAMRKALGAGRARIIRQLLTESVLLSAAGGLLGILFAWLGVVAIPKLVSGGTGEPFPYLISPDARVLAFTIAITLGTGILSGLAPTLRGSRADLTRALRENASSTPGAAHTGNRLRIGDALVVLQVALSIVVLIGAGLLVRTLLNIRSINPGFDTHNILIFGLNPSMAGYKDEQMMHLYAQLQERFATLPGVVSAAYSDEPLLSGGYSADEVHLDGAAPNTNVNTDILTISPTFFSAMRIPLLAGRTFNSADFASALQTDAAVKAAEQAADTKSSAAGAPASPSRASAAHPVAPIPVILNETFARQFFPGKNPIGMHMGNEESEHSRAVLRPGYRIIGISGDTKYKDLRRPIRPALYMPLVASHAYFELRAAGDPNQLATAVRNIVAATDSRLPIIQMRTQTEQIARTHFEELLLSRLSSFFAILATLLACIGLYGLLSYEVASRTREFGIRMALGAQKLHLMRLVVRHGILLSIAGIALGVGGAFAITRFMAKMLYNIRPNDPGTFAAVAALLLAVALAACILPALRAIRVDPLAALRSE
ncbi:ABC transporter permease [Acidobacteria bacterium AB60]|nr:ABC transporter permease [Acidobacteria bacterium AB60]